MWFLHDVTGAVLPTKNWFVSSMNFIQGWTSVLSLLRILMSCFRARISARHAPHAAHFHAREFVAANVTGTQNVLDAAVAAGGIPVVYSSTTSLTITNRVKSAEAAGHLVWLDETSQPPVPATDTDDPTDAPRQGWEDTFK